MTNSIDSVKNYLQWNKADWRAYFRTHGQRIVTDYDQFQNANICDLSLDTREVIWSKEFQETMVKVGIFGGAALFDQIPSRWNNDINPDIPVSHSYGQPQDFTHITALATRLILCETDRDEGVLIKLPGQEPLLLLKLGSTWEVEPNNRQNMLGDKCLPHFPKKFEQAAELIDSAQEREELERHFSSTTTFAPSLVQLIALYVSADRLTLDKHAMQKRKIYQQVTEIMNSDLRDPVVPGIDVARERKACRIAATLIANCYLEEEEPAVKATETSWASTISQICSSLCDKLSSFIRWCLSFFL